MATVAHDDHEPDAVEERLQMLAGRYTSLRAVLRYHRGEQDLAPSPQTLLLAIRKAPELALVYRTNAREMHLAYAPKDGEAHYATFEHDKVEEAMARKGQGTGNPVENWEIVSDLRARGELEGIHPEVVPIEETQLTQPPKMRANLKADLEVGP